MATNLFYEQLENGCAKAPKHNFIILSSGTGHFIDAFSADDLLLICDALNNAACNYNWDIDDQRKAKDLATIFCGLAKIKHRIERAINRLPAADVKPVIKSEWTRINYEPCGHDYKCSVCGWLNDSATPFCPNCGADMSKEV